VTALMLKLAGGGLLVISGALLGGERTAELRRTLRATRRLSEALGILASELTALQTPLPAAFMKLREEPFFALLSAGFGTESMAQLWHRAAAEAISDEACRLAVDSLGEIIGRYDAARQAGEIAAVRARLEARAAQMEENLAGRERHAPGLGAALGAILAALLF